MTEKLKLMPVEPPPNYCGELCGTKACSCCGDAYWNTVVECPEGKWTPPGSSAAPDAPAAEPEANVLNSGTAVEYRAGIIARVRDVRDTFIELLTGSITDAAAIIASMDCAIAIMKNSLEFRGKKIAELRAENAGLVDLVEAHESADASVQRLVRDLDVIWNGEEGAARWASLCDMVSQIRNELPALRQQVVALTKLHEAIK